MTKILPFRRPQHWPPQRDRPRIVPLSRALLAMAVALERDEIMAEMASGEAFAARALAAQDLSVAVIRDGYLIGAGGLVLHWLGRAEAWALVSANADARDVTAAVRLARGWLDYRQRNPIFRRIECYIRDTAPWRVTFMHALGFEPEGRLDCWGPDGKHFDIYARVREYE